MTTRVKLSREKRIEKINTELRRLGLNKTLNDYPFSERQYFLGAWLPERHLPTVVAACVLNLSTERNLLFRQLAQNLANGNPGKRKATKPDNFVEEDMRLRGVYFDLLRYMSMVGNVSLNTANVENDAVQSDDDSMTGEKLTW